MLLRDLAATSAAVAAEPARSAKIALLADVLRRAGPEAAIAVSYLAGDLRQRRTGVGYASLRDVPAAAAEATLTLAQVDAAFERIAGLSGAGSQAERRRAVHDVFGRATDAEQRFLAALTSGELRQGALDGVMVEAVARAAQVPLSELRRAVMVRGAIAPVAESAMSGGSPALAAFHLEVGRPVQPMLAQPSEGIRQALERISPAAIEWKLDGVRVQVHRDGPHVRVFTRTLDDFTDRLPEVVDAVLSLSVGTVVLDGEALALREDGTPHRFQVTASRVGSRTDVRGARRSTPLTALFFDILQLDGTDLLAEPADRRQVLLSQAVPAALRVPRLVTGEQAAAEDFLARSLASGHEGVVVKSLTAAYDAGRRGGAWLKVKPRHTLDLVVLAAEWGHGRRRGWLSNLHLGAIEKSTGQFVMLGKTFKGLTDAMLRWQTPRLLELESSRNDWQVFVRPELVVEVAFDGVQTSSRYPGGVALRFARVLRYREDKPAAEADTIDTVRAIHAG